LPGSSADALNQPVQTGQSLTINSCPLARVAQEVEMSVLEAGQSNAALSIDHSALMVRHRKDLVF
jgi:hypothetical protein